jgi:hypothetical protein
MSTLTLEALATSVKFDADNMWVILSDGRQLGVPLAYFPRLAKASPAQRKRHIVSGGIALHWDELDEDISVPALLAGHVDRSVQKAEACKKGGLNGVTSLFHK